MSPCTHVGALGLYPVMGLQGGWDCIFSVLLDNDQLFSQVAYHFTGLQAVYSASNTRERLTSLI